MNYKWCNNWTHPKKKDYRVCLNWTCVCGHAFFSHAGVGERCVECTCRQETYNNNDNCSLECQFKYKVQEALDEK